METVFSDEFGIFGASINDKIDNIWNKIRLSYQGGKRLKISAKFYFPWVFQLLSRESQFSLRSDLSPFSSSLPATTS